MLNVLANSKTSSLTNSLMKLWKLQEGMKW